MGTPEGAVSKLTEADFVAEQSGQHVKWDTIFPLSEIEGTENCPVSDKLFVKAGVGMVGNDFGLGQPMPLVGGCNYHEEVPSSSPRETFGMLLPKHLCTHTKRKCENCILKNTYGFVKSSDGKSKVMTSPNLH